MKKYILLLLFIASQTLLIGQTEVTFQINHKLGSDDFEFDTEAENNLGHAFDITRIEYYLSSFTLYHDDGQETAVEDLWILSNGSSTTSVLLGDYDITQIDSISFAVGVEEAVNHDDPSLYATGHPLGFQNPSMHWGWASGYRFVALEGNSTPNLNSVMQIHALGDDNYFTQTIVVSSTAVNNELTIQLDADYIEALNDIYLDIPLIIHGFGGEATVLLENFRDFVFSPSETQTGINELHSVNIQFYPNPVNANDNITFKGNEQIERVTLLDLSGRTVQEWREVKGQIQLDSHQAGTYLMTIYTVDGGLSSSKLIIQ